ncbi:hypothetical protein M409DRAFT_60316 [Zasmidium cellare ATCC 36951]|uniref:Uncharacterized protein n=1 Tax=Zasmidium cellare ATCC 36951 TaxID=1080233 RepID=A0A6A6BZL4_ZASCE|nr:uncharacterized protein M409DRAFT_60316 [Zasmidium cellare ATCC 36951]KAF2160063.1 hypothetical protein M409DRAFT_60316 [Zasmidium cellare ATCC 36951]
MSFSLHSHSSKGQNIVRASSSGSSLEMVSHDQVQDAESKRRIFPIIEVHDLGSSSRRVTVTSSQLENPEVPCMVFTKRGTKRAAAVQECDCGVHRLVGITSSADGPQYDCSFQMYSDASLIPLSIVVTEQAVELTRRSRGENILGGLWQWNRQSKSSGTGRPFYCHLALGCRC